MAQATAISNFELDDKTGCQQRARETGILLASLADLAHSKVGDWPVTENG